MERSQLCTRAGCEMEPVMQRNSGWSGTITLGHDEVSKKLITLFGIKFTLFYIVKFGCSVQVKKEKYVWK